MPNFHWVILSDLHLKTMEEPKAQQLLEFLYSVGQQSQLQGLLFNGDIFEFCFGGSSYFQQKFKALGAALVQLAQQGIQIIFVEGNHEFYMRHIGWQHPNIKFLTSAGSTLTLANNTVLRFCHGDSLLAPWHYFFYMRFVRSAWILPIVKLLPQRLLDQACLWLASLSRQYNRALNHPFILSKVKEKILAEPCHIFIMGHFHYPYTEVLSLPTGKTTRVYCVDSWEKPNCLLVDANSLEIHRHYF